jgi:ribonucleoside-diphosphate reductase alpha chain
MRFWVDMLFSSSSPWMTFKDVSNERYSNKHQGTLHGSNLCTEILLHSKHSTYDDKYGDKTEIGETAVCCLHPVNLQAHMTKNSEGVFVMDYDDLRETIRVGVRALDNIISINRYLTKETEKSALSHRAVGLGTMGWADCYYLSNILQDSEEGIKFAHTVMEKFTYDALEASSDLAAEKGKYSTYDGSLWSQGKLPIDTWREFYDNSDYKSELVKIDYPLEQNWDLLRSKISRQGMRNSNVVAIAPTASTAYLANCEQSIEPSFRVSWTYENLSGITPILNEHFSKELQKRGLWTKELTENIVLLEGKIDDLDSIPADLKRKYCSVYKRDMKALIYANACRQKFVDQGISFNIYTASNSRKELVDLYMLCWKLGLKTTYYLRTESVSNIKAMATTLATESKLPSPVEVSEVLTQEMCSILNKDACEMCQ